MVEPKVLFMLVDGVAEVGLEELGGLTYLQHAKLPTLDTLAASG
jgi:2,3-bisphosphoglycerate-independent phosphoglycerate mutase